MKVSYIHIQNYKNIKELEIKQADQALILVGKNNTGKTTVLDALRLAVGDIEIKKSEYFNPNLPVVIEMILEFLPEDINYFWTNGIVSNYKRYDTWKKDFYEKLPSFNETSIRFSCIIEKDGRRKYQDFLKKNNIYIKQILPKIYHVSHMRDIQTIEQNVLHLYDNRFLMELKSNKCMFDQSRDCNQCFQCIGVISKKSALELTAFETRKLLEYKIFHSNLKGLSEQVTKYFQKNGSGFRSIEYMTQFDINDAVTITTNVYHHDRDKTASIYELGEGLKSIYALSLLEAYIDQENIIPGIIMIEDPEIYLHPQMQKVAGEIIYRLAKKNQVMFTTHSPFLLFNFSSKQIKQVILDQGNYTTVNEDNDIDDILDDLGYTANDIMNVSFVFIVEGKQDSNRLPMLLEKYYSEIYDEEGKLQRISIIPTNSCTNIKTYANLKYINKIYLKDQFLIIRDSDGKNPKHLVKQLCSYYGQRAKEDVGNLPRVTPKNVLILKYYSFENYFLDPKVMEKIGVIKKEKEFYEILFKKYKDYLYKLSSVKRMKKHLHLRIETKEDIKKHIEAIKIYVRGHNLFDIFYGKYRNNGEEEILKKYIEVAPRENFKDILMAIDKFIFFENRKKMKESGK